MLFFKIDKFYVKIKKFLNLYIIFVLPLQKNFLKLDKPIKILYKQVFGNKKNTLYTDDLIKNLSRHEIYPQM